MKKLFPLFFFLVIINQHLSAQFSHDLSNPLAVCDAVSAQTNVRAIKDGSGGYFVFWMDIRTSAQHVEIYGQHLDADGNPQWTANGKAVFQTTTRTVTDFRCINFQGGILIAWIQGSNGGYPD